MSDREELIALELANMWVEGEDGYRSIGMRTNEGAADIVLKWLQEHDRKVKAAAFEEGIQAEKNREPFQVPTNPYQEGS